MEYILILYITYYEGLGLTTARFEDKKSCELAARNMLYAKQKAVHNGKAEQKKYHNFKYICAPTKSE